MRGSSTPGRFDMVALVDALTCHVVLMMCKVKGGSSTRRGSASLRSHVMFVRANQGPGVMDSE